MFLLKVAILALTAAPVSDFSNDHGPFTVPTSSSCRIQTRFRAVHSGMSDNVSPSGRAGPSSSVMGPPAWDGKTGSSGLSAIFVCAEGAE